MHVYLLLYLVLFWIPVVVLTLYVWPSLDFSMRCAVGITCALMYTLTTVMEYVYLALHVWTFSQAVDPLVGIWIKGAPIEEFVFWYGASSLFLVIYLTY